MAEIRVNATGGLKLYDADDSHYAQIVAGTITSNVDAITLGHDTVTIADNLSLGSDSAILKIGNFINLDKERSIDVIITRLRKKIEENPKNPKYLQTIRGEGYVLWIE